MDCERDGDLLRSSLVPALQPSACMASTCGGSSTAPWCCSTYQCRTYAHFLRDTTFSSCYVRRFQIQSFPFPEERVWCCYRHHSAVSLKLREISAPWKDRVGESLPYLPFSEKSLLVVRRSRLDDLEGLLVFQCFRLRVRVGCGRRFFWLARSLVLGTVDLELISVTVSSVDL